MLDHSDRLNRSNSASKCRVESWLDSLYCHHSSLDEDDKKSEKSSLASNNSSTNLISAKNSIKCTPRKNISTSSSSSYNGHRNSGRRIILRRPRYLVRNFRNNKKLVNRLNRSSEESSYFSGNSLDESRNVFSISGLNFLNNDKQVPEIKADDLDFETPNSHNGHNSFIGSTTDCSNCSNTYSTNNHSFGILEFEQNFDQSLNLSDDLVYKVKIYAFNQKDIKIKIKKNTLLVVGKQIVEEEDGWFKREFQKKFDLPLDADKGKMKYDFDKNDHLIITIPRLLHSVH